MNLRKGDKVRLVKSDKTELNFGYYSSFMASVGEVLEVVGFDDTFREAVYAKQDGESYTYHVEDLELVSGQLSIDTLLEKKQKELEEKRLEVESLGKELSKAQEQYDSLADEISVLSQANAILKLEGGK